MHITFHGAAQTVTGSRHLIELQNGKKLLLECGIFQSESYEESDLLNREFGFSPDEIDYLILSHAHMDHSGNIPRLVREGFNGKIYCTPPTRDLCSIMHADSAYINGEEIKKLNLKREEEGLQALSPIYDLEDVNQSLSLYRTVEYDVPTRIDEDISFTYTETGHILGSAAVNLEINENGKTVFITYTGDIGRPYDRLLRSPAPFPKANIIICESTYGSRLHNTDENPEEILYEEIINTCLKKKGNLLIPAFSLGRTQEIVYALAQLNRKNLLPKVKIFVDSPLALRATAITARYYNYFNDNLQKYIISGNDPLFFKGLKYIKKSRQSKAINNLNEPCIIISASGMLEGGRILHHLKQNVSSEKNTVLFVGFCTPASRGGQLLAGSKTIEIDEKTYNVNAEIKKIESYSAHADYKEMIDYLKCQDVTKVSKIFMVHGEPDSQLEFKKHLTKAGFSNVISPKKGESFEL